MDLLSSVFLKYFLIILGIISFIIIITLPLLIYIIIKSHSYMEKECHGIK